MDHETRRPKQGTTTVMLGSAENSKLDIIADRYGVSRSQAARWVIDAVDPFLFLPSGRMNSTVEQDETVEGAAA